MARRNGGRDDIIVGLIIAAIFGFLFLSGRGTFWIFPCVFVGVIPVVRTIFSQNEGKKRIGESRETTQKQRAVDKEKQILSVAQKERGKITPSLVALKTSLSIEEAEEVLQDLVRRGHASMEVTGDGRIEYRFPEFMSGGSSDSG